MIRERLIIWLVFLLWLLITVVVGLSVLSLYFYNFYQKPSIVYKNLPTPIELKIENGHLNIYGPVSRCSKANYLADVSRTMVNGLVYYLPPQKDAHIDKGCVTVNRFITTVPPELPAGTYHMNTYATVHIKWMWLKRDDVYHITSQNFTIPEPRIDPEAATTEK